MSKNTTSVRVNVIGDDRQLAKTLKQTENRLARLKKKLKSANGGVRGLLKGASAAALIAAIGKVSQAADEDNKSLAKLAITTNRLTGASADQIKALDAQIQKLQFATGIADDELRPAFQTLLLPLRDTAKAFDALELAADVAAGTGKDLSTVSSALAKAFGGNTTALNKLVPGIKNVADPMKFLQDTFSGTAESVSNLSPFQKLGVVFQDIAEQVGTAFLPLFQQLADYLTGPEGKEFLKNMVQVFQVLANGLGQIITFFANVVGPMLKFIGFNYEQAQSLDVVTESLSSNNIRRTEHLQLMKEQNAEEERLAALAKARAQKEKERLKGLTDAIQGYAEKFRDSIDLTMGLNKSGTRFSAERVIREMKKVLDFAKKLPDTLKALAKAGASTDTLQRIMELGPLQGYAVASGLLKSGKTKEFQSLSNELGVAGQRTGLAAQGYTININKANMSASEIVNAIKAYERSTGRKLLLNG